MRIIPFLFSLSLTIALIFVLNTSHTLNGSKTPCFGSFLSPQHGFWQNAEPTDYDYNEQISSELLKGNADVFLDDRLVPHVYADNETDLYFIQGYLHAKFRLWQMEFQTHAAGGRLSEIFGASNAGTNFLRIDKFFRRLGMVYGAEKSLAALEADSTTKTELDAYTAGVNAYISKLKPNQYPLEYKLLNYKPELWTNLKTQLFLKYMCFDLAGYDTDFEKANMMSFLSKGDMELLFPSTQDSLDPIIPRGTVFAQPSLNIIQPPTDTIIPNKSTAAQTDNGIIQSDKRNGSNNWAVAGSKTQSGAPILCNDPHLALNLPSLWFEIQLSTPGCNVYGVSFPGAPSVIIGYNDSIAWGVTNAGRDVKDYYEVIFKDTSMQEYWYNGLWNTTTFRDEVIYIKDSLPVREKIALTHWGPVMYDQHYKNILQNNKFYALRWKAHDISNELLTFNKLNHANNYSDYLNAINTFETPGQNFVFASKSGDIAIKQQGSFPAKWPGQGDVVMPGSDSTYQWQGFIPTEENPMIVNPERAFVSSANQLAADSTYPYYQAGDATIFRGKLINRYLSQMNAITVTDMQQLQNNNYNLFAEMARPLLAKYVAESQLSGDELKYYQSFMSWNLSNDIDEKGPIIFDIWWQKMMEGFYKDELSQTTLPVVWPDNITLVEALLKDSTYKFSDNINTSAAESVSDVIWLTWKNAVQEIKKVDDEGILEWGKYKNTGVRHLLKIPALGRLGLAVGGGEGIINATTSDHGPSWRMIVQLSSVTEAYGVYPGGQNGNPGSKFYDNFLDNWVKGKYFSLLFITKEEASKSEKMKWKMKFEKV